MIFCKTREEIEIMRESAQLVSKTLGLMAEYIEPGITPLNSVGNHSHTMPTDFCSKCKAYCIMGLTGKEEAEFHLDGTA